MSDPEDKPLRGPSRPLYVDWNVEFPFFHYEAPGTTVSFSKDISTGNQTELISEQKLLRGHTAPLLYVDDYGGFDLPTPGVDNRKIVIFNFGGSDETPEPDEFIRYIGKIWVRPVVPSKQKGRKGTRKGWKRRNPPKWKYFDFDDLYKLDLSDENGRLDLTSLVNILRDIAVPPPPIHFSFTEATSGSVRDFLKRWSDFVRSDNPA